MKRSDINAICEQDEEEAVIKIAGISKIVKMARDLNMTVSFATTRDE